jgi:hypothetical protein
MSVAFNSADNDQNATVSEVLDAETCAANSRLLFRVLWRGRTHLDKRQVSVADEVSKVMLLPTTRSAS